MGKTYTLPVTVKGAGDMLRDAIAKAKAAIVSADDGGAVDLTDLHEDITILTEYTNTAFDE